MGSLSSSSTYSNDDTEICKQIPSSSNEDLNFVRTSVITPTKSNGNTKAPVSLNSEVTRNDETPVKNLPLKRRSLMRDMEWNRNNQSTIKHPMEMRMRKRSKFKPYSDRHDYVDFGDDLWFLFEDSRESQPRSRRSRKKRSLNDSKGDFSKQKGTNHSQDPTSINDANILATSEKNFSKNSRPNLKIKDLFNCNKDEVTSENASADTSDGKKLIRKNFGPRRKHSAKSFEIIDNTKNESTPKQNTLTFLHKNGKNQKRHINNEDLNLGLKKKIKTSKNSEITPKFDCNIQENGKRQKRLSCVVERLENIEFLRFWTPNRHQEEKNNTVTKMTLRRRHSTPSLGGDTGLGSEVPKPSEMSRTVSTPARAIKRECPKNREDKSTESQDWPDLLYPCDDSAYSVDSPDSGFVSESSCSAATPDGENVSTLNFSKCDEDKLDYDITKLRVSRSSSNDSGIQMNNEKSLDNNETPGEEGEERLILSEKPIKEAERLKREQMKKEEDERLREQYQCRWVGCSDPFESRSTSELHLHLEKYHAENYCCKWEGCRCFGKMSRKTTFLQRHIGEHSGEKPHKCIFENCGASFSSLSSRKRHVEAHYSEVTYPKARVGGDNGNFPRHLLNSRRVQDKRKTLANRHDCMDGHTLCVIKNALIQNEVAMETDDDVINDPSDIVFHPEVIGQRIDESGQILKLVKWAPSNMLPNEWVSESEAMKAKRMKKCDMPWNAKSSLKRLFFFGRKPSSRKPSRKSMLLESLFR